MTMEFPRFSAEPFHLPKILYETIQIETDKYTSVKRNMFSNESNNEMFESY